MHQNTTNNKQINKHHTNTYKLQNSRGKTLTEMEKWEYKQLMQAGVLDPREHPLFDEEGGAGVLAGADEGAEEEFEIDLNDRVRCWLCLFWFLSRSAGVWLWFLIVWRRRSFYSPPTFPSPAPTPRL